MKREAPRIATNAEGEVDLSELPEYLATNPSDTQDGGSAAIESASTYSGVLSLGGLSFAVAVDAEGVATFSLNGTDVTRGYTQSDVTVGSYTVTAAALTSGVLSGSGDLADVAVESHTGSASATFGNGVVIKLANSDVTKVASASVSGEVATDTSAIKVGDVTYRYEGTSESASLVATSAESYAFGLNEGTGVDKASFTAKSGEYTLVYSLSDRAVGASDSAVAVLTKVTHGSEDLSASISGNTFRLGSNTMTATGVVDSAFGFSGELIQGAGAETVEEFVATSGSATVSVNLGTATQALELVYDGESWSLGSNASLNAEGKLVTALGDEVSFAVSGSEEQPSVVATAAHGLSSSETTQFTSATAAVSAGTSATYTLGTDEYTVTFTSAGVEIISKGEVLSGSTVTLGSSVYSFSLDSANNTIVASPVSAAVSTSAELSAVAVLGSASEESSALGTTTLTFGSENSLKIEYAGGAFSAGSLSLGSASESITFELGSAGYIGTAAGYTVQIASDALADGKVEQSEVSMSGTTTTTAGQLITYKFDDTHYYAFLVDSSKTTDSVIMEPTEETTIVDGSGQSFAFSSSAVAYFKSSADGTWAAISGAAVNSAGGLNLANVKDSNIKSVQNIKVTARKETTAGQTIINGYTVTPGAKQTVGLTLVSDATYKSEEASFNVEIGDGNFVTNPDMNSITMTFHAGGFTKGMNAGDFNYVIKIDNIKGTDVDGNELRAGSSNTASRYTGDITITTKDGDFKFTEANLTALFGGTVYDGSTDDKTLNAASGNTDVLKATIRYSDGSMVFNLRSSENTTASKTKITINTTDSTILVQDDYATTGSDTGFKVDLANNGGSAIGALVKEFATPTSTAAAGNSTYTLGSANGILGYETQITTNESGNITKIDLLGTTDDSYKDGTLTFDGATYSLKLGDEAGTALSGSTTIDQVKASGLTLSSVMLSTGQELGKVNGVSWEAITFSTDTEKFDSTINGFSIVGSENTLYKTTWFSTFGSDSKTQFKESNLNLGVKINGLKVDADSLTTYLDVSVFGTGTSMEAKGGGMSRFGSGTMLNIVEDFTFGSGGGISVTYAQGTEAKFSDWLSGTSMMTTAGNEAATSTKLFDTNSLGSNDGFLNTVVNVFGSNDSEKYNGGNVTVWRGRTQWSTTGSNAELYYGGNYAFKLGTDIYVAGIGTDGNLTAIYTDADGDGLYGEDASEKLTTLTAGTATITSGGIDYTVAFSSTSGLSMTQTLGTAATGAIATGETGTTAIKSLVNEVGKVNITAASGNGNIFSLEGVSSRSVDDEANSVNLGTALESDFGDLVLEDKGLLFRVTETGEYIYVNTGKENASTITGSMTLGSDNKSYTWTGALTTTGDGLYVSEDGVLFDAIKQPATTNNDSAVTAGTTAVKQIKVVTAGEKYSVTNGESNANTYIKVSGTTGEVEDVVDIYTNGVATYRSGTELNNLDDATKAAYRSARLAASGTTYTKTSDGDTTQVSIAFTSADVVGGLGTSATPSSTYTFSDTSMTVTVGTDLKISGVQFSSSSNLSGASVTLNESAGTATWTDTTNLLAYSAAFVDNGDGQLGTGDKVTVTTQAIIGTAATAQVSSGAEGTDAKYSASITLGSDSYTVSVGTGANAELSYVLGTATVAAPEGYTVKFVDATPEAVNSGDEYFVYYENGAVSATGTTTSGSVTGQVGTNAAVKTLGENVSYSINGTSGTSWTASNGSTITLGSDGKFTIAVGSSGATETLTVAASDVAIERTITGASIAGVSVEVKESGTSISDLSLYSITGGDASLSADGSAVVIGGISYTITKGTSASEYSAAVGDLASLNLTTEVVKIPTTYTFSAGKDYVVVVDDGKVKEYESGAVGEELSEIVVKGDVEYTFSYSNGVASGSGAISGAATYSTIASLNAEETSYITVNGERIYLDDFENGTYTTTYGGMRRVYTLSENGSAVTIVTSSEAEVYTIEGSDEDVVSTIQVNGEVVDADRVYSASWTAEGSTYTTVGTSSEILAAIGSQSEAEDFELSLVSIEEVEVEVIGERGVSYIRAESGSVTAAIVDNVAELGGVTFTFEADGSGTYTTVSASGQVVRVSDGSFVLEGQDDAVLATLGEDGVWEVAAGIDNVTNSTSEPLAIRTADGDEGTLAAGASYNPESNSLTNAGEGSIIKNEEGYATSEGEVTGLGENGSVSYDEAGNLVISGANSETKLGGEDLPVSGDDNYDATISGGEVAAVGNVSDGASVDVSKVGAIEAEDGATISLTGEGEATVNGAAIAVNGDEDGITATISEEGELASIGGVSEGASVSVPEGTAVGTDEGVNSVGVNGTTFETSDPDGIVITPTEEGYAISGLNGDGDSPAYLSADSEVTVAIGDATYSVGPEASLRADGEEVSAYTRADQNFDNELSELGIDSDTPVVRISAAEATQDEEGNNVYDLSEQSAGVFRLDESEDGEPYKVILPEEGASTAIIPSDFEGEVSIEGGNAGSSFINQSANAVMNATGGSGADYFKTGSANDKINLSNGGADTLDLANGGQIEEYDPLAENAPAILTDASNQAGILDAVLAGRLELSEDGIENGDSDITIANAGAGASDNRKLAKFMAEDGSSQLYAWNGGEGDLTSEGINQSAVYVGNAGGTGSGGNISTDNDYADTVVAGAGDVVNAGNGDTVELMDNASGGEGAQLASESENTSRKEITVNGFHGGFERGSHGFRGASKFDRFSFANGVMSLIKGAITFALNGWTSAGYAEKLAEENEEGAADANSEQSVTSATNVADASNPGSGVLEYRMTDEEGNSTNNVAIASEKEYMVDADYAGSELSFQGESVSGGKNGTSVNFGNVSEDVTVDLSGETEDGYEFENIQNVKGGAGNSTLIGGSESVGLYAGSGSTSIYGGSAGDSLYSYEGESSNESTFFYTAGSGADSIKSFDFGAAESNDKVDFSSTALEQAAFSGEALKITVEGGDVLTIEEAKNNIIKADAAAQGWSGAVEFGDDLTYDTEVKMYGNVAEEGNKLTINDSNAGGEVALYMNGKDENGKAYDENYYYNVNNVDASGLSSNASIAGGDYENDSIAGGSGSNSLWGGLGGDDTLVGGSGENTFFYLLGDGNDVVTNAKSGDTVELWNVSISDIDLAGTYENSSTGSIEVKFNNGSSLKVEGSGLGNVGFKVGDETWKINSDKTWRNSGEDESNN